MKPDNLKPTVGNLNIAPEIEKQHGSFDTIKNWNLVNLTLTETSKFTLLTTPSNSEHTSLLSKIEEGHYEKLDFAQNIFESSGRSGH